MGALKRIFARREDWVGEWKRICSSRGIFVRDGEDLCWEGNWIYPGREYWYGEDLCWNCTDLYWEGRVCPPGMLQFEQQSWEGMLGASPVPH